MGCYRSVQESFDTEAKINVFRYKRNEDASTVTSMDRMLQVNDYNSGTIRVTRPLPVISFFIIIFL